MIEICENCKNCKRLRTEELLKDYDEESFFSYMPPFELFLTDKVVKIEDFIDQIEEEGSLYIFLESGKILKATVGNDGIGGFINYKLYKSARGEA